MLGRAVGINNDLPGMYLMQALWDVGPSSYSSGNEGPISWQELAAYASVSETVSEPWELRAVMKMSKAYIAEKAGGKDPLRIPPVERGGDDG
jgi:hypothetical protein